MPAVMEAIDRMSIAEKVEVMNYLWAAISRTGEKFMPVWQIDDSQDVKGVSQEKSSQYGALKGRVKMTPDFDAPLEDFAEYM